MENIQVQKLAHTLKKERASRKFFVLSIPTITFLSSCKPEKSQETSKNKFLKKHTRTIRRNICHYPVLKVYFLDMQGTCVTMVLEIM